MIDCLPVRTADNTNVVSGVLASVQQNAKDCKFQSESGECAQCKATRATKDHSRRVIVASIMQIPNGSCMDNGNVCLS